MSRRTDVKLIDDIDIETRCYEGASTKGQLAFARPDMGWCVSSETTGDPVLLPPAAILAMGITECCADMGRGKVFWFYSSVSSTANADTRPEATNIRDGPQLVYTDFVWDDNSKNEWFQASHLARLNMSNARPENLNPNVVVIPLSLTFDRDNYDNVRIRNTFVPAAITYNLSGYTYLGFLSDLAAQMHYSSGTVRQPAILQADKSGLDQFQMRSGPEVANRLHEMWLENREGALCFLRDCA